MIRPGPLYGLVRARNHALFFIYYYLVSGIPWAVVTGLVFQSMATSFALFFFHVLSVIVVLPAAIAMNFLALRIFRSRSWRREHWRAWVAGILGPPLMWGGTAAWMLLQGKPPEVVLRAGALATSVYLFGIVVLFSNLAILIAWLLPVRRAGKVGM